MRSEVVMPALSAEMTEADVIAWLVKPGDRVAAGDIIAELETDKSTVELEAAVAGLVVEILVPAGTREVPVGEVLAVLDAEGEAAEAPAEIAGDAQPDAKTEPAPAGAGDVAATALARRLADQAGLDLREVAGSGAGGRVVKADIQAALSGPHRGHAPGAVPAPPPPEARPDAPYTLVPHTRIRRTIAARLSEAKRTVPHFYLRIECDIDGLLSARARLNEQENGARLSVNDFVVRAAALALVEVPAANVGWSEEGLLRFERVDVAVAVATDSGLITPILRNAARKSLRILSNEMRELASRAREGRLRPDEYRGGTFCVSNLGMYGVESVFPILNPPQAGILGVGAGEARPVVRDGQIVPATRMTCTLSADHRALDGAVGAEFLAAFKRRVEDPLEMLL
ncbi:MAG: dihydrolipoamide acetyltransferase family protein, partial [Proteobacteria bacterium]|nr:dihydrolipoamide acetyltransferase family protein [Pseudomonadota bacterium]